MAGAELGSLENPENYKVVQARIRHLWNVGETTFLIHAKKNEWPSENLMCMTLSMFSFTGELSTIVNPRICGGFKCKARPSMAG